MQWRCGGFHKVSLIPDASRLSLHLFWRHCAVAIPTQKSFIDSPL